MAWLVGFLAVPVFPFSTTVAHADQEGAGVDYAPRQLPPLADVAERLGVTGCWEPLSPDRLGACAAAGDRISVGTHDPAVFFHELAHATHARLEGRLKGSQDAGQETVAEFTAAVLMALYGLADRSGNAWEYIGRYSTDPLTAITHALATAERVLGLLESLSTNHEA